MYVEIDNHNNNFQDRVKDEGHQEGENKCFPRVDTFAGVGRARALLACV
jgi:hypothetical protein